MNILENPGTAVNPILETKSSLPQTLQKIWHKFSGGGIRRRERIFILVAIIPCILFYTYLRFYPVGRTFYLSMTDAVQLKKTFNFIGLQNYLTILKEPQFLKVIWNTTYYSIATTLATTALAFIFAIILNPLNFGNQVFRLIYFLPTITSTAAIAIVWTWLYQPRFGLFNYLLRYLGIKPIGWLTSTQWAMPSLIIMAIWGGVGFSMLIFIAGLRGIPSEYYEAAQIDGASSMQLIRFITIPLLSRVFTFVLVTGLIGSFQVFQQVFLMTRGGPLDATRVLSFHIYEYAFKRLQVGIASSMSFVLFVIVSVLTIIQLKFQQTDWEL